MKWLTTRRHPDQSPIDSVLSHALQSKYANLSRRAFLSAVTRRLIGLTGIAVATEVLPFLVPAAQAQQHDPDCGLHGPKCDTGNCTKVGAEPMSRWVACCPKAVGCTQKWQCCTYTDWCATTPRPYTPTNCVGPAQSGTSWCSVPVPHYWCTTSTCAGAFPTSSCGSTCGPPGNPGESWCD